MLLREMIDGLHDKRGRVNYSVTGQSIFARFVKLPTLDEEKIERIISFEAQQNVPFPIDEVVWDYQLIGDGAGEQSQVVLAAIKMDLLDEINKVIEDAGLRTSVVDVAAMARYNAFRYNYSELNDCSLLINIGAHTTNLLFVEAEKFFSRTVQIGGGSITAAIAKEFGESFAAAEFRKKRGGNTTWDCAPEDPADVDGARVAGIARGAVARLQAELVRSISHYCVQHQGDQPKRIFLGGGGAGMPHMREFLREKLQLPVEFFNPLRNVAVGESARGQDVAQSAHLLGELIGLALRAANDCPMKLNLRPATVVRRQDLEKRRPFLVMSAAALLLACSGWGFYYTRASQLARQHAGQIQEKINAPMRAAKNKIDKLRQQQSALDKAAAPLVTAINDRFFWIEILKNLNARLPKEDIWLTELSPMSGGKPIWVNEKGIADIAPSPNSTSTKSATKTQAASPTIDGIFVRGLYLFNSKQQEVVVDYFRNLVGSPFFKVDPNNQSRVIKSTIPNNTEWAFPYELRLELRKPVRLP